MKLFQKIVVTVMAMAMLTACSGGGGGAGGGGGTPISPSTFSNTKTYKLTQNGEGKPLYMEYWQGYTDDTGAWIQDDDIVIKEGSQGGNAYSDIYVNGVFGMTMVSNGGVDYAVCYPTGSQTPGDSAYDQYVQIATFGGATIPKGKAVSINLNRTNQILGGNSGGSSGGTGTGTGNNAGMADPGKLNQNDLKVEIGTYTMPGTSVTYYAEIFTSKSAPGQTVTYAYGENDELKAVVAVNRNKTEALFFNKFEYGSSEFKAAKLNIKNYDAMDITDAYIDGLKKMAQGGM